MSHGSLQHRQRSVTHWWWCFRSAAARAHILDVRVPEAVVRKAEEQFGVVSMEQALSEGLDKVQIHRLIRAGRLERVGTSCLRFPGQPETWRQLLTVGRVRPGRGQSGRPPERGLPPRPRRLRGGTGELPGPRRNRNLQTVGAVHSSARIRPIDRVEIDGFACTSAPRTIVDLAARGDRARARERRRQRAAAWLDLGDLPAGAAGAAASPRPARRRPPRSGARWLRRPLPARALVPRSRATGGAREAGVPAHPS